MARLRPLLPLFLLLLLSASCSYIVTASTSPTPVQFRSNHTLSRFVYSEQTQSFLVGGVNILYQLDHASLSTTHEVVTGPQWDSPSCHATGCHQNNTSKKLTDNVNKVLLIDTENGQVLTCGSVFQGACVKYPLRQLTEAQGEFLPEPVAANAPEASTFAFIGPQRYNRWGHGNVVYVGTTFTSAGDYRHDVPAIASRNLHDLRFAEYSFSKQSLLRIDVKYRDRFLVNYVYGFNTTDHVYFATVQKRSHVAGDDEKGHVSRLARVCVSDANFDTYTEVTIQCRAGHGRIFPILRRAQLVTSAAGLNQRLGLGVNESVLLGVFSPSEKETAESAVCLFPMSKVERLFSENIHNCFNGSMKYRSMEYISGPIQEGRCPIIGAAGNVLDFCEVGLKISGRDPISAEQILTLPEEVTALSFDETEEHNIPVLVLGTTSGQVVMATVEQEEGEGGATVFSKRHFSRPMLQVAVIDKELVFLQEHGMQKLPVAECTQHEGCESCLSAVNPYCGWCTVKRSCQLSQQCGVGNDWLLSSPTQQCIHLEEVRPSVLARFSPTDEIFLRIKGLPHLDPDDRFVCRYNKQSERTAQPFQHGVACPNPLNQLGGQSDQLDTVELDILLAKSQAVLLTTSLPIFDCSKQDNCGDCLASPHCHWCIDQQQCQPKSQSQCLHSDHCAKIQLREPVKIANNHPVRLRLPMSHLPSYYDSHRFFCLVSVESAKLKVNARVVNRTTVVCDRMRYKYLSDLPEVDATASVLADDVVLDSVPIVLFKCEFLGRHKNSPDCSLCLTHREDYGCSWCDNSCAFGKMCPGGGDARDVVCPKPQIFFLHPTRGPVEGGTHLTIEGSNLANNFKDVAQRIKLGGQTCTVINVTLSVEVTCIAPRASREQNVSVELASDQGVVKSSVFFQYKDFAVFGARPNRGPRSGGAVITISGRNFDIGSHKEVFLGDVPCILGDYQQSKGHLVCYTQAAKEPMVTTQLTVRIDNAIRSIPLEFHFTPDPVIRQIKPLSSYFSGGRTITIHGEHFLSAPSASCQLLVYLAENITAQSDCVVLSDRLVECVTPSLKPWSKSEHLKSKRSVSLGLGLKFANVSSLLHLTDAFPLLGTEIMYERDPFYANFTDSLKLYKGDQLVIEGDGLSRASDTRDVLVRIGDDLCNVTALTERQLLCVPPPQEPHGRNGDYPQVIVQVGPNLEYKIGFVQYSLANRDEISSELIGAIAAIAAILVFLAVAVLIILKHKSTETEREYKRIQIQMDNLEKDVRSECKQAFAELQTDITDLTMELETSGIPIHSYKKFLLNVFFPGVSDHPVLLLPHMEKWPEACTMTGLSMVQFEQMLLNKRFLLCLIDTLENQPGFGARDRVNFASLLSVVLSTRMEYFSDVLRTLLSHLVQRTMNEKNPQQMLRRTETTIVEKLLTNWLAVCLYDYVKDHVGPSLFVLYKAIKCQIEKGPVDLFTQEARYSLSEEGLLRQSCDCSSVVCLVLQRELDEAYETKVLDCDSISQVKSKILSAVYKNTPFSLRPSVDEIDLEWQCGQDAHVVLQDLDLTTKEVAEAFRKVNTLRHYGIKNKAVVSLVPKQFRNNKTATLMHNSSAAAAFSLPSSSASSSGVGGAHSDTVCHSPRTKLFHLTIPDNSDLKANATFKPSKSIIPEVFLTRLLSTKGTLKKFIDDFFDSILRVENRFPCSIKWLYDLFDSAVPAAMAAHGQNGQASLHLHQQLQGEMVDLWKSNSLCLRFWTSLIRNPDLVYDVEKTHATDLNLGVIAQTLMAACTSGDGGGAGGAPSGGPALNKELPSHRLLFAKEISDYQRQLGVFYADVQRLPAVHDQEFNYHMNQLSQRNEGEFNQMAALKELFLYVDQYYNDLYLRLNASNFPDSHEFVLKLENISRTMNANSV